MDHSCLNDQTLWCLLDMEIFDWEGTNCQGHFHPSSQ